MAVFVSARMIWDTDSSLMITQGTSFPVTNLLESMLFYRTDEDILYQYDGASWDKVGKTGNLTEYEHTQGSTSTTWVIPHSLNSTSLVLAVYDNSSPEGLLSPVSITITDANNITLTFSSAQAGRAVVHSVDDSLASTQPGFVNPRLPERGINFTYESSSKIKLTPTGIDNLAIVRVYNGTEIQNVPVTSPLECDLTVSGAGGLDTGAEAADTGYYCYLITKNDGADPVLIFSTQSDGASITMPGSYTYYSKQIFFVSNDSSSDIVPFDHIDNTVWYRDIGETFGKGIEVLAEGGGAPVGNATGVFVDCTGVLPEGKRIIYINWRVRSEGSSSVQSQIRRAGVKEKAHDDESVTENQQKWLSADLIANGTLGDRYWHHYIPFVMQDGLTNSLGYGWPFNGTFSGGPFGSGGIYIYVLGFETNYYM